MTNRLITPLIPTTDARAYAMMHELMRDCATAMHSITTAPSYNPNPDSDDFPFDYNPRDEIRDHDDYLFAASMTFSKILDSFSDILSPLDELHKLFSDNEFLDDCMTLDFDSPLLHCIDFDQFDN